MLLLKTMTIEKIKNVIIIRHIWIKVVKISECDHASEKRKANGFLNLKSQTSIISMK